MSDNAEGKIGELEEIIRALADVFPSDRDNVMVAGAKFEEFIGGIDDKGVQLQKLINLAWQGMKHLYEEDDFFMAVKTSTMQGINTIREYMLSDGNIAVEDFEQSCQQLEKALSGGKESADSIIEVEEAKKQAEKSKSKNSKKPVSKKKESDGVDDDKIKGVTLNDLASNIMMLNEEKVTAGELGLLVRILKHLSETAADAAKPALIAAYEEAVEAEQADKPVDGWLAFISQKAEEAIEAEQDEVWGDESQDPAAEETSTAGDAEEKDLKSTEETEEEEVFVIPVDSEEAMLGEFVTECSDLVESAEVALLDLEESPDNDELINTVFRSFHTVKGTSAFMGLDPISEFTHSVETLLSMVREGDLSFDMACADITLESIDILKKMLAVVEVSGCGDPLPKPAGYERIMRILNNIFDNEVSPADAMKKEGAPVPVAPVVNETPGGEPAAEDADTGQNGTADKSSGKSEAESTVRVNVSRLDRLIDMVGELVIAHSVVAQDQSISEDSDLMKKVNHTTKILRELQDTSLILRMVPLRATFHKMNRLVRDLARKAGKSVKFSTVGEDTEIDRNMVDIINEPLVHMLRNSLDHGIESPEERAGSGKSETANIWLRAYQEGGKVVIEIEDDGKGINKDKVLSKAIEKGLVDPDKKLTDSEIFSLIFLPGFSSAEQVTDLSGRGVGMDVVRRSIEQLQGKVEVSSQPGKGTKVSLEIPFTLAITDGMLVKVGDQRFIIPTINIDMTFRAVEDDIYTMLGSKEHVSFRGESVPVIRLHRLFSIENAVEDLLEGTMLIIKNNNKRYALLLDEVIGQQQLVGKSINMMVKMPHISGGAILGDGRVGLILDTSAVAQ
ncbi:chemotaxis protein CheA [Rhodohalobacter sp. SW132]|uniref:chemotaxis protein CheA n=1 Tax=Rhodohalobacter sp. SW132 TaxID=2293433 RepID=UPI000E2792EA|nr:chemotaxis protein CheA [Rhodohalobacter sp. SW132]REL38706.1 chemotaxis protein CheA [Rhodohalobacter sp. SW132]